MTFDTPTLIAGLLAILFALIFYALFAPRKSTTTFYDKNKHKDDGVFLRFISRISHEFDSALPQNIQLKDTDEYTESLLNRAANPWNVTVSEFRMIRITLAFLGLIVGLFASILLMSIFKIDSPLWLASFALSGIGYYLPRGIYSSVAEKRDYQFKKQLPDALELILISREAGESLTESIRSSIPNMSDSVLKDEFKTVMMNINTGMTIEESLQLFGERVPNEGIKSFVSSLREASRQNADVDEAIENRANASREEYYTYVSSKIEEMPEKATAMLAPLVLGSLLIAALAPTLNEMLNAFSGGF